MTWTSDAGLTSILSPKSDSEAPRDSRMTWLLPLGILTPPKDGAESSWTS